MLGDLRRRWNGVTPGRFEHKKFDSNNEREDVGFAEEEVAKNRNIFQKNVMEYVLCVITCQRLIIGKFLGQCVLAWSGICRVEGEYIGDVS